MSRSPGVADVLAAARITGWPRVPVGRAHIGPGAARYHDLAWQCSPGDCREILSRLGQRHLLVVTEPGRARLRRWLNRRWARPTAELAKPLAEQVRIYGDPSMVPPILDAFRRVPRPVAEIVGGEDAYVVCAGAHWRGWTGSPLDEPGRCPIVVTGTSWDDIVETTIHEAAHRWCRPQDPSAIAQPVAVVASIMAYARREGWPVDAVEAAGRQDEQLTRLLELAWRCREGAA